MYCIKCGKQIEDGRTVCEACEAAQSLPYNPSEDPLNQPQAAPEQPFVLNNPAEEAPKPAKKKKRFPVGAVVAAALVVAIVVTAVFCWDAISGFFVRSFGSPEDYMDHVEENSSAEAIHSFTAAYGQILNALGGSEREHTGVEGEMRLQLGEELLDLVEMGIASSGGAVDLSWLSDIKLDVSSSIDDDLAQNKIGIGLGKTTLATVDMIMDMGEGDIYLTVPELTGRYIQLSMEGMGMDMSMMGDYQVQMAEFAELLPSEEKLNEILTEYWALVLANVQDVEKDTETVEVEGVEQKLNVITCTITEEDLLNIAIAILEDVQDDEELMDLVIGIVDYVGSNTVSHYEEVWNDEWSMYEWVPVYEDIDAEEVVTEGIEDALESLEEQLDEADDDNCVNLTTYVDNSDKIVGRNIEIEGTDMDTVEISYITVWQKNEFAFEASIADQVEITGTGEREKNLISGEYDISFDGEDILTLEISDYDEKLGEEGYINGTFTLVPSDEIIEKLADEMGASGIGSYLDFAKLAVELKIANTATSNDIAVNIKMGGGTLLGISIKAEYVEGGSVKVPSETVDMDDQEALLEWVMDMDFEQLLNNLDKAGVPSEYVDILEAALSQLDSLGGSVAVPDYGY